MTPELLHREGSLRFELELRKKERSTVYKGLKFEYEGRGK